MNPGEMGDIGRMRPSQKGNCYHYLAYCLIWPTALSGLLPYLAYCLIWPTAFSPLWGRVRGVSAARMVRVGLAVLLVFVAGRNRRTLLRVLVGLLTFLAGGFHQSRALRNAMLPSPRASYPTCAPDQVQRSIP
jgi:hypothetical protein